MPNVKLPKSLLKMSGYLTKHSPEILTGVGIAGMVVTVGLSVKATPKAITLIENKKAELDTDDISKVDIVKTAWKPYIPAAITGITSIACIIGANSVNLRRNATLAAAYSLSETAIREYKDKVVDVVGEEKVKEVKRAIAKDKSDNSDDICITKNGDVPFIEPLLGHKFTSSKQAVIKAMNDINYELIHGLGYASLNDFYIMLGLKPTDIGKMLGWHIDMGKIDIEIDTWEDKDNEKPMYYISFSQEPKYDYDIWG